MAAMSNNASNMEDLNVRGTLGQPPSPASAHLDHANLDPGGGTTPVPIALIDRVMPTLRDTELRVLLVVVRQTLGWQVGKDPSLRKERDWLTQSQLMRRTGRASGAVARAVDALVRRGLIDVMDGAERLLMTPAERRRCLGRLYYRLHRPEAKEPKAVEARAVEARAVSGESRPAGVKSASAKSAHAKRHTTKETLYKNKQAGKQNVDNPVDNPLVIRSRGWVRATDILSGRRAGEAKSETKTEARGD